MSISRAELLDSLQKAYEMEEVMADLLNTLAMSHVLNSTIPERDKQKVLKLLATIHQDTLEHQQLVGGMIKRFSKGTL